MPGLRKLLQEKREEILRIASRYGAGNVRVFGSVQRDEDTEGSDVDLLVDFEEGRSLLDQMGLIQDLEDLLGCRVDIVTEAGVHWYIRDRILKEARAL